MSANGTAIKPWRDAHPVRVAGPAGAKSDRTTERCPSAPTTRSASKLSPPASSAAAPSPKEWDPFAGGLEADGPRVQPIGQVLYELTPRNGHGIDTEFVVETSSVDPSHTRPLGRPGLEPVDHPAVTVEFSSQFSQRQATVVPYRDRSPTGPKLWSLLHDCHVVIPALKLTRQRQASDTRTSYDNPHPSCSPPHMRGTKLKPLVPNR